jgi:hypothetical protein
MDGLTTSTSGKSMRPETGAMSCSRLNGSASKRVTLTVADAAMEEQRVAVRGCADGCLDRDIAGCAGLVFDDDRLAETLRQPLGHDPRHGVSPAARRKPDDPAQRPCRVVERKRRSRERRRRKGCRSELQELTTRKCHRCYLPMLGHKPATVRAAASAASRGASTQTPAPHD